MALLRREIKAMLKNSSCPRPAKAGTHGAASRWTPTFAGAEIVGLVWRLGGSHVSGFGRPRQFGLQPPHQPQAQHPVIGRERPKRVLEGLGIIVLDGEVRGEGESVTGDRSRH